MSAELLPEDVIELRRVALEGRLPNEDVDVGVGDEMVRMILTPDVVAVASGDPAVNTKPPAMLAQYASATLKTTPDGNGVRGPQYDSAIDWIE